MERMVTIQCLRGTSQRNALPHEVCPAACFLEKKPGQCLLGSVPDLPWRRGFGAWRLMGCQRLCQAVISTIGAHNQKMAVKALPPTGRGKALKNLQWHPDKNQGQGKGGGACFPVSPRKFSFAMKEAFASFGRKAPLGCGLLEQAVPVSFGITPCGWAVGRILGSELCGQFRPRCSARILDWTL
ncbi:unnamed protein product [Symbiodinium sp. CCMP2592]|nr:unnamed protein product [Symbiodinium sp. CCMP2592]